MLNRFGRPNKELAESFLYPMAAKHLKRKQSPGILKSVICVFLTLLAAILVFLVGAIYIFEKGPSTEVRDLFVVTVQQSSAAKPLARLFLSKETVSSIMENNSGRDEDLITDTGLVEISDGLDMDGITVEDVIGPSYRGKVMIINDPSRVYVYSIPDYNASKGYTVSEMVEAEDAIAGINGGGFMDKGGLGNGSIPLGIVMSNGVWRNGSMSESYKVIGLNTDNKLVLSKMTGKQAVESGIRDAVCWGPALIVNGEPVNVGEGGGLNPRSAIGQRADGAIILLVIDGRQPSSLGASYLDLIGIMQDYGAVNAANLDGGNSSSMVYEGQLLTRPSGLDGERGIPTGILVRKR